MVSSQLMYALAFTACCLHVLRALRLALTPCFLSRRSERGYGVLLVYALAFTTCCVLVLHALGDELSWTWLCLRGRLQIW